MALCYRPGRIIVTATKDRFTNNLPELSQLLVIVYSTDELDTITSNLGTIFSNTLETVAPIKLKKVREKRAAPWYNSYTHSLKKETHILERKWRKTNLEVFRIAWKNSMSCYRQALKTARTVYIRKLIDNHQNNPRFLFSTVARLTNKQMSPDLNIPSQFNSNDFMNLFNKGIGCFRESLCSWVMQKCRSTEPDGVLQFGWSYGSCRNICGVMLRAYIMPLSWICAFPNSLYAVANIDLKSTFLVVNIPKNYTAICIEVYLIEFDCNLCCDGFHYVHC